MFGWFIQLHISFLVTSQGRKYNRPWSQFYYLSYPESFFKELDDWNTILSVVVVVLSEWLIHIVTGVFKVVEPILVLGATAILCCYLFDFEFFLVVDSLIIFSMILKRRTGIYGNFYLFWSFVAERLFTNYFSTILSLYYYYWYLWHFFNSEV